MLGYQTAGEKAVEWSVTPHHVQFLCRTGKIEGAIKRAGAWFIPDNTPNPIKNTKSGSKGFPFIGTKSRIFDSAIQLFVHKGFNYVSLQDIADHVGIRQSSIYNHFKSKQEILDAVYDFYCHYYREDRPSRKEMELVTQSESPVDIIKRIRYDFKEEYSQKMADITKIIFQRLAIDDRAREIGKSLMVDEGVQYVEDVFNDAIQGGRFAPFNTRTVAVFINAVRIFTLYNWIVDSSPEAMGSLAEDEQALYEFAARFITDLKPAAGSGV